MKKSIKKIGISILSALAGIAFALGCITVPQAQTVKAETDSQAYFLYSDFETKGSWYIGEKTSKDDVSNRVYGTSGLMIPYMNLEPTLGGPGNPVTDLEEINDFSENSNVNYVEYPDWLDTNNGIVSNIQSTSAPHGYWMSSSISATPMEYLLKRPDTTLYTDVTKYREKSFHQVTESDLEYSFNVVDSEWHQVAVFCRTMVGTLVKEPNCFAKISILDASGRELAQTTAETYDNGAYFVFMVKGSFTVRLEKISGSGCGLAGIFLDDVETDSSIGISNFAAMRQGVKDIHIGWTKKSDETVTLLYRKEKRESAFAPIAIVEGNGYVDTDTEPASLYEYMLVPAKRKVLPTSVMANATVNDMKNSIGAMQVAVPDESLSLEKETAPYDLTKIEFEKVSYIVPYDEELHVSVTVYVDNGDEYVPYAGVEVYFTLGGSLTQSFEGTTAYPNMNLDMGTAITDTDGKAALRYRQEYAGEYTVIAKINNIPDAIDPEKGTAASSAEAHFTQAEKDDEKMPALWTVSDAIKPGDAVTLTGNNLLPNSDLTVAYAPSVQADPDKLDEENPPTGCKYLSLEDLIVVDSTYETGLSFIFPETETAGAYDIWVKTSYGWSNGITMNAARPLYMNQDGAYEGVTVEVVGRNYYVSDFGIGIRADAPQQIKVKLVRISDINGNADGIAEEVVVGVRTDVRTVAEKAVNNQNIDWTNPYKLSFITPKVSNYGVYAVYVSADGKVFRGLKQPQTLTIYEKKAQAWDENVFGPIVGNTHVGNDPLDLGFFWAQDLHYDNVQSVTPNAAPMQELTQNAGVIATTNDIVSKMKTLSANGGGVLYFPEGSYYITSIVVPENVILVGAGADKTKVYCVTQTGGGIWIRSYGSNVGVARMHLELYEYSTANPDWIVNMGENSTLNSYIDERMVTVNKFMTDCSTKFSREILTNGANTRAMIGLGGKAYFLMQNCYYNGGNNPLYNSYSPAYATMRNVVAENISGMSVAPTLQSTYAFIENVYVDLCGDGHAFSLRDCAYIADSFVTGSGSYDGANIGEMIVFEPPGGYFATGRILSAGTKTFTMALHTGQRIDEYSYYKYNGIALYITAGKGAGQLRYFNAKPINGYGNEYAFVDGEKDWDIIPDSTSQFTIISPMEGATVYRFSGNQNKKGIFLYSVMFDSVVAECNLVGTEGIYVGASDLNNVSGRFCPNIGVRIENNVLDGVSPMTGKGGIGIRSERSSSLPSWGMQIMNVSIRGNTLVNVGGDDPYYKPRDSEMTDQRGIAIVSGCTTTGQTASDIRFITIENNRIDNCEYGIYCENRTTGVIIRNNSIGTVEAEEKITYFAPEASYFTGQYTFYVDDAISEWSGEYVLGEALPTLQDKENDVFLGWTLSSAYDTEAEIITNASAINTTLYAVYGKQVVFNLNYEKNGANAGVFNTVKVVTGNTVESQVQEFGNPFRVGYNFAGWYVDEACTIEWDASQSITSNQTVYAKWVDKNAQQQSPSPQDDKDNGALPWIIVGSSVGGLVVIGGAVLFIIKWKKGKSN